VQSEFLKSFFENEALGNLENHIQHCFGTQLVPNVSNYQSYEQS